MCPGKHAALGGGSAAVVADDAPWADVNPLPGALTCNVGDCLQYLTGGRFKSTCACVGAITLADLSLLFCYLSLNFVPPKHISDHRVRLPRPGEWGGERLSLAYFANVGLHTPLADVAAPEELTESSPAEKKTFTFLDLLARRQAEVPLGVDGATGAVLVDALAGKAGGPDFAIKACSDT